MGVFGRGHSPTAIIRDGVHATKIYVGEIQVWDGTRPALVNMVRAHGVGGAPAFGVSADSVVAVPVASGVGVGLPPVLGAVALVSVPAATGSAGIGVPVVTADSVVAVPACTASVDAHAPTGAEQFDVTVSAVVAEGSGLAPNLVVAAGFDVLVEVAAATGGAPAPAVSATGSALVGMVATTASAMAVDPAVSASSPIAVPAATASAAARAPGLSLGGGVTVPVATGTTAAPAPVVTTASYPMGADKNSTAQNGTVGSWTQVNGFTVRSGFPNTVISSNALAPNGGGTFTFTANIRYGYEYGIHQARIKKLSGGVATYYTGNQNNYPSVGSGNTTRNVAVSASVSVAAGDLLSLEFFTDTSFSGAHNISTGSVTYLYFQ